MWETAERVQKNPKGEYRALMGGEWVPVVKAQKNKQGKFRVQRQSAKPDSYYKSLYNPDPEFQPELSGVELLAGNPAGRFALGAGAPLLGSLQLGANLGDWITEKMGGTPVVGDWINQKVNDLEEIKQRGQQAQSLEIPYLPDVGGEGMDLIGAGGALSSGLTGVKSKLMPSNPTYLSNAAVGGGYAASMPTTGDDFATDKAIQTGAGAFLGANIPVVFNLVKLGISKGMGAAKDVYNAFSRNGYESMIKDYHKGIIGSKELRDKLVRIIEKETAKIKKDPHYNANAKPTTGQTVGRDPAGSPIVAQEKVTAQTHGGPSTAFGNRYKSQEDYRKTLLQSISGTDEQLAKAENARSSNWAKNWEKTLEFNVKADQELVKLSKLSSFKSMSKKAANDMKDYYIRNPDTPEKNTGTYIYFMRQAVKKKIDAVQKGKEDGDLAELLRFKNDLTHWLESKNPAYKKLRLDYKEDSKAINQMQLGREIEDKLFLPTGKESPGAYLKVIDDATQAIKKSLGMPRLTIDKILSKEQLSKIEFVAKDLERELARNNLYQKTNLSGASEVSKEMGANLPGLLSRPIVVTNFILNRMVGRKAVVEAKIDKYMTDLYLNPEKFAAHLKSLSFKERVQTVGKMEELLNGALPIASGQAASE